MFIINDFVLAVSERLGRDLFGIERIGKLSIFVLNFPKYDEQPGRCRLPRNSTQVEESSFASTMIACLAYWWLVPEPAYDSRH